MKYLLKSSYSGRIAREKLSNTTKLVLKGIIYLSIILVTAVCFWLGLIIYLSI